MRNICLALLIVTVWIAAPATGRAKSVGLPQTPAAGIVSREEKLGQEAFLRKDYAGALTNFEEALRLDPKAQARILWEIGLAHDALDHLPEAVAAYQRAISLIDPKSRHLFIEANLSLAYAYEELDDFVNAERTFRIVANMKPADDWEKEQIELAREEADDFRDILREEAKSKPKPNAGPKPTAAPSPPPPFFTPPAAVVSDDVNTLCTAINSLSVPATKALVTKQPDVVKSRSCGALEPPLVLALRRKSGDMFEFLLASGADVNAPDAKGQTPLIKGLYFPVAVSMLPDKGAERQARDERGHMALDYAKTYADSTQNPIDKARLQATIRLLEARPAKSSGGAAASRPLAFGLWAFSNSRGESWILNLTFEGDVRRPSAPPGGTPDSWSRQGNEIQFATAGSVYFVGTITDGRIAGRYTPPSGSPRSESKDTWVAVRLVGIGASFLTQAERVTISSVVVDSPSARAGLKSGDIVLKVNDRSATGADIQVALREIQGGIGTSVTLTIQVPGDSRERTVVLVREPIKGGH